MAQKPVSRRDALRTAAVGIGVGTFGVGATSAETASWQQVASPVDVTLTDVKRTARNEFAVGTAGVVVERTDQGWVKVVDGGPSGDGNDLLGADVTDDGKRLWFVGASGAIGEYDVETGNLEDRSAPNDVTNNFNDVAVTGTAGEANVYVAGDSGSIQYSFDNGATGTWNGVSVGQGAAIEAIDFHDVRSGHLVNGNANAFATTDGTSWNRIGPEGADVSLFGVDSNATDDVWVAAGSGTVFTYRPDAEGTLTWFSNSIGQPSLQDVEIAAGDGYAVGDNGAIFDRADGTWTRDETPTTNNLNAVVDGSSNDVAVGASGTMLETNPDDTAESPSSGGEQEGDAGRVGRASTETSESKSLTFTVENVGSESVTITDWVLKATVQVETISRSGAEVTIDGSGVANSVDGFPVDGSFRPFDTDPTLAAGETGQFDFGLYDGGNVALSVEPTDERPDGDYVAAAFTYGDGTDETFFFRVTNVNS